jgi:DNA-directed RNA polymerase subunit RPC12/RpoP
MILSGLQDKDEKEAEILCLRCNSHYLIKHRSMLMYYKNPSPNSTEREVPR